MKKAFYLLLIVSFILVACGTSQQQPATEKLMFVRWDNSNVITDSSTVKISIEFYENGGTKTLIQKGNNPNVFPDGKRIVYEVRASSALQDQNDIWVANTDGSNQTNLTQTRMVDETFPQVSPDGKEIAFIEDGNTICFMNSEGKDHWCLRDRWIDAIPQPECNVLIPKRLELADHIYAWEPQQTKGNGELSLVVGTFDTCSEDKLYRIELVDGMLNRINKIADNAVHPAIGPDGKIAYWDSKAITINTVQSDGSNQTIIVSNARGAQDFIWSPDSSKIGYTLVNDQNSNIYTWVANSDGSEQELVSEGFFVAWSPDGKKLLISRRDPVQAAWDMYKCNLYLYDLEAKKEIQLTNNSEGICDSSGFFLK